MLQDMGDPLRFKGTGALSGQSGAGIGSLKVEPRLRPLAREPYMDRIRPTIEDGKAHVRFFASSHLGLPAGHSFALLHLWALCPPVLKSRVAGKSILHLKVGRRLRGRRAPMSCLWKFNGQRPTTP
jgi:hypothetical protein